MSKRNPFYAGRGNPFYAGRNPINGRPTYALDAQSRIHRVQEFDEDQCLRALEVSGVQKTVVDAIHRRLRKLQRDGLR